MVYKNIRDNKKILEIDISGQIQQINYDSVIGCRRHNGIERTAYLSSKIKKEILKKYKAQVTDLIEKLHCILVYYCIRDKLENVEEIKICKDVSFRRIKNLLPFLFKHQKSEDFCGLKISAEIFKHQKYLQDISINQREGLEPKSGANRIALKAFRKKRYADIIITKEMIEDVLLEFKRK